MPGLEGFLTEHGGMGAFAALLLLKVGEMLWNYFRTRDTALDRLKQALDENTKSTLAAQADLKKFKTDLHRAFKVLKKLSGDKWPEIMQEMESTRESKTR
jgi:hypothetical protein